MKEIFMSNDSNRGSPKIACVCNPFLKLISVILGTKNYSHIFSLLSPISSSVFVSTSSLRGKRFNLSNQRPTKHKTHIAIVLQTCSDES